MALMLKIVGLNLPELLSDLIEIPKNEMELYIKIEHQGGTSELSNITVSTKLITGTVEQNNKLVHITKSTQLPLKNYTFVPDLIGENFIKQGYEYLKTLNEFSECTDC